MKLWQQNLLGIVLVAVWLVALYSYAEAYYFNPDTGQICISFQIGGSFYEWCF